MHPRVISAEALVPQCATSPAVEPSRSAIARMTSEVACEPEYLRPGLRNLYGLRQNAPFLSVTVEPPPSAATQADRTSSVCGDELAWQGSAASSRHICG